MGLDPPFQHSPWSPWSLSKANPPSPHTHTIFEKKKRKEEEEENELS